MNKLNELVQDLKNQLEQKGSESNNVGQNLIHALEEREKDQGEREDRFKEAIQQWQNQINLINSQVQSKRHNEQVISI
jgi:uncharacterized protein YukE